MVESLSIREFARRDGCDDSIVRRKIASGHLIALPDGKLDAALVGTDWRKRTFKGAGTAGTLADDPENDAFDSEQETAEELAGQIIIDTGAKWTKAEAERVKENYLALLKQIDYDRESGLVVDIKDIAATVGQELARVRTRLMSIPSETAPQIYLLNSVAEVQAALREAITEALQDLTSDAKYAADASSQQLKRK